MLQILIKSEAQIWSRGGKFSLLGCQILRIEGSKKWKKWWIITFLINFEVTFDQILLVILIDCLEFLMGGLELTISSKIWHLGSKFGVTFEILGVHFFTFGVSFFTFGVSFFHFWDDIFHFWGVIFSLLGWHFSTFGWSFDQYFDFWRVKSWSLDKNFRRRGAYDVGIQTIYKDFWRWHDDKK